MELLSTFGKGAARSVGSLYAPLPPRERRAEPLRAAFLGLYTFFFVYCVRPQDWIPGANYFPFAKIAGCFAVASFILSVSRIRRGLPREVIYMILLLAQLCLTVPFSPVWRGKAFIYALDFSKVVLINLIMALAVTTLPRLRRLMFVQTASVAMVVALGVWKGRNVAGRLVGVLQGVYANPNELAFAIVLSLPIGFAFMLRTKKKSYKLIWGTALLLMTYAVFLTASRSGFLALLAALGISVFEYGIKGSRRYVLLLAALVVVIWLFASGSLNERLAGTFGGQHNKIQSAYGSTQQRRELLWHSLEVTAVHPLLGIGPGNFEIISGHWQQTHNSFTQMSAEAGLPALILYILILRRGFINIRNVKQLARAHGETELLLFASAMRASLVAYLLGSFFDSVAYMFFPYFLVAFTTALFSICTASGHVLSEDRREEPQTRSAKRLEESYG